MGELHGVVTSGLTTYINPTGLSADSAGWASWNMPPGNASSNSAITSGVLNGVKVPWPFVSRALTTVGFNINSAGATLSGSQIGVLDTSGNVLGTASADAAFVGTGFQTVSLAVAAGAMPSNGYVYVAFLAVGTTGPTMKCAPIVTSTMVAMDTTGSNRMFCILGNLTGLATIPAGPVNMANNFASGNTIFAALK